MRKPESSKAALHPQLSAALATYRARQHPPFCSFRVAGSND
jgi:hypothetical protein